MQWILGDRFASPAFCNAVMFHLFKIYSNDNIWLTARMAENVYSVTNANSKVRLFVKALIATCGPLSPRSLAFNTKEFLEEWNALIHRGGEIVLDIKSISSFSDDDPSRSPW